MRHAWWLGGFAAYVAAATVMAAAQIGGKPVTGNPTPGTAQPEPPNLTQRITLTGCLRPAPKGTTSNETRDANTPSDARFVLTSAERVDRVPPGTGGSAPAVDASSRTYRLQGLDSQFSPFMDAKVEISGEVRPRSSNETGGNSVPTLLVEFVQRINSSC